jgi:hypothetical protein
MANARVKLTPRNLSDLVWFQWLGHVEAELADAKVMLNRMFDACELSRGKMDYNTGSISFSASLALYLMTRSLEPLSVFEVGTFIGKSTLSMALAIDRNGTGGKIYTCDGSNDFHLPQISKCPVQGFSKTTSTDALAALAKENVRVDMLHIDGRLGQGDIELIERIADPRVVIALDDFEGIEKGVANFSLIRGRPFFSQHFLVYPMSDRFLEAIGCRHANTTALLLPMPAFTFTYQ